MLMRLLYVCDSNTVSGAELVMLSHIDHLRPPAWERHVFLDATNARLKAALDERGCPYTATSSYSRILLETRANPTALLAYARAFRAVGRELETLIARERIDLVHAVSYPASLYAAVALRRSHVPGIWHEHNIKRIHAVNRHLYRWAAKPCAWAIGPSQAVCDVLLTAGIPSAKVRRVHNGIDLGRFKVDDQAAAGVRRELRLTHEDAAIGLAGQLIPSKGHHLLIEAAPQILARVPRAQFFFVGALANPPYEAELRSAINRAKLADRFRFLGWRRDMPAVIRAMDSVVLPTTKAEPAALTLLETMAMSRPIVASRTGGTPELIVDGETGLLFPAGDAAALARQVVRCLDDRVLAARLGVAGRARVEASFTLTQHLDAIEELYDTARRP